MVLGVARPRCGPDYSNLTRQGEPDILGTGTSGDAYQAYNLRDDPHQVQVIQDAPVPNTSGANGYTKRVFKHDAFGNLVGVLDDAQAAFDLDTDKDGCTNGQEAGANAAAGGKRNAASFWDFGDQYTGSPLDRVAQFGHNCSGGTMGSAQALDVPTTGVEPACGATGVTCYSYDAQGALAKKQKGTNSTVYVSGLYEKNLSTGEVTKYYTFGGGRVAMRECPSGATGPGPVTYLLGDQLGSTTLALDENGAVDSNQKYYPYGRLRSPNPSTLPTDKLYTGHQKETAAEDLHFMQARFYDAKIASFLSADTIVAGAGNPASWNRYAYVQGNPLRYTDPTGHYHDRYSNCGDDWSCGYNRRNGELSHYGCWLADITTGGSFWGANVRCWSYGSGGGGGGVSCVCSPNHGLADLMLWAHQYNHQLGHYACGLVPGHSIIGLVVACYTRRPANAGPVPTVTPLPGGVAPQATPPPDRPHPSNAEVNRVWAECAAQGGCNGTGGGCDSVLGRVACPIGNAVRSDCFQGVVVLTGATVVIVGSVVTGASLVEGGFLVTTTVGTTVVSGSAIAFYSAPPGGIVQGTYRLGSIVNTGVQNAATCFR